jgi:cbb3-type cytochrome oxidase subunit 3
VSLSDIMGNMDLSVWAQAALVLFLIVFLAQAVWTYLPRNHPKWKDAGQLPLLDDDPPQPSDPATERTPTNRRGDA